jgi:hypothetical protein
MTQGTDIGLPDVVPADDVEVEDQAAAIVAPVDPICLSAEDIFGADDHEKEWVPCPEWAPKGSSPMNLERYGVWAHQLTGQERDAYEASLLKGRGKKQKTDFVNIRAKLISRSCQNDAGDRIFTDRQAAQLGMKSSKVLDRIFDACQKLNGMTEEDIDELEGN